MLTIGRCFPDAEEISVPSSLELKTSGGEINLETYSGAWESKFLYIIQVVFLHYAIVPREERVVPILKGGEGRKKKK